MTMTLRTLASLQENYNKFVQSGYNIKNASCHNNVIEKAIFDLPIDQVFVIPFFILKCYLKLTLLVQVVLQKEKR